MKTYKVTFTDTIKASTEEEAYGELLDYLSECVRFGDVTAFDFAEESELLSTLKEIAVMAASKNDCRSDIIFIANEAIAKAEGAEL
jgi:hypothetical protein